MSKLDLYPTENILHRYHQSGVVLLKPILLSALGITLPWFFLIKYELFSEFNRLWFVFSLICLAYLAREFILWSFNKYIITDQRLIKMSHEGLFKKLVVETPLDRILNVSYKTTGILSMLGKFGDVEVQIVGLMEPMILRHINDPSEIKDYLWKLHSAANTSTHRFEPGHAGDLQRQIGYTKDKQKIL